MNPAPATLPATSTAAGPLPAVPLEEDRWLGGRLGRPAYRVRGVAPGEAALAALPRPAFVEARVDPADPITLAALAGQGFRLVDTNLSFERPPVDDTEAWPAAPRDVTVRDAGPADAAVVANLAARAFTCSRFHLDPAIDDAVANDIKSAWAANYFRGARGDAMVVAESPRGIVGFLLALRATDDAMVIDLVAVDAPARGCCLAAVLTRAATTRFPAGGRLRVGTQLANRPACAAYQAMGFTLVGATHVLHRHLDPRS